MAKAKRKASPGGAGRPARPSRRPAVARAPTNPWAGVERDGATLHIGHFPTFQLIRLANAAKANVTRKYLADFGLSVPEWRLLAMTVRFEPVRFSELVANSSIDKGQASRTLQVLTRRGLIAAQTLGGGRRRMADSGAPVILTITAKGRRLYETLLPVAQRNQARLLYLLSREERRALWTILNKLFAAIGDLDVLT